MHIQDYPRWIPKRFLPTIMPTSLKHQHGPIDHQKRGLSVSCQHLQPRMVYVTDQGFAVKPASHILRMLRAVTAPPMIRVGSLSGVAATLPCFGKRAAGRNVGLKRKKIRKDAARHPFSHTPCVTVNTMMPIRPMPANITPNLI